MSNTEEYLDDLLGSLSDGEKKEEAETTAEETPEVMPEVTRRISWIWKELRLRMKNF